MGDELPTVDSYYRYKAGTAAIAKWLVKAALTVGLEVPVATARTVTKARTTSSNNKQMLTVEQFTELAQGIARQDLLRIKVGGSIVVVLREVIDLRRAANAFFQKHARFASHENASHAHFINVLEGVLHSLEAQETTKSWSLPKKTTSSKDVNRPDAITLQASVSSDINADTDTDAEEREQATVATPPRQQVARRSKTGKKRPKPKPTKQEVPYEDFDVETSVDDLYVNLFHFFKFLNDTQLYLDDLWKEWACGNVTLVSASVTTDLAFDLVKRSEREFLEIEVVYNGEVSHLCVVLLVPPTDRAS